VLEVDARDVVMAAAEIKSAILERAQHFARAVVNLSGGMRPSRAGRLLRRAGGGALPGAGSSW